MSERLSRLIPNNWTIAKLGDLVIKIIGGGTPSKANPTYYQGNIPWMTVKDMTSRRPQTVTDYITIEAITESATNLIPPDTIIIATRMSLGKIVRLPFEVAINQDLKALILPQNIEKDFIEYWFLSEASNIQSLGTGTTVKGIRLEVLHQLKVPLSPLKEQRRIVAKIEALKARSQRVKEELEDIPQLLDQFRQSVLAAAFRGDLTADWREQNSNVEPAEVLLERIQEKILISKTQKKDSDLIDPFKIPNNWKWVSLSSICHSITDGDHQAPPKANHGIPFLVISNITNGKLDFSNTRYVPEEYYRSIPEHRKPKKGDILYSVVGSYGIPVIVDTEEEFCFQRHIALFKMSNFVNSKYFLYALKSNFIFKQATEVATGTAQLTVTLSGLRKIKIPLISIDEQLEIIHRIETFFKTIDIIQQQYQETKAHLDQLDQSILAKAFRGELVPQDPDDEPASALLERIRAERDKLQTKAAKKSTTKTSARRTKKTQPQQEESVQLDLGLE